MLDFVQISLCSWALYDRRDVFGVEVVAKFRSADRRPRKDLADELYTPLDA